jgi:hypothetical protein
VRRPGHDQRHDRQQRDRHQHRGARLQAEHRQQQEAGAEAAADRARRVGEVEHAGASPDRQFGALDDAVGEREAEPHEQRRHADLEQDRPDVEPELGQRRSGARLRGVCGSVNRRDVGERHAGKRRRDEHPLRAHEPFRRPPGAALHDAPEHGAGADADQDHGEQQREHGAKAAEQHAEVAEPQDLHPHGREAGEGQGDAGEDDRSPVSRLWSSVSGLWSPVSGHCRLGFGRRLRFLPFR